MTDLPNVDERFIDRTTTASLGIASGMTHPPRILLLFGSLRERSYSKLLALEVAPGSRT